jgi:hypothetical protein
MSARGVSYTEELRLRTPSEVTVNFIVTDVHAYQADGRTVVRASPPFAMTCSRRQDQTGIHLGACEVVPCEKLSLLWQRGGNVGEAAAMLSSVMIKLTEKYLPTAEL